MKIDRLLSIIIYLTNHGLVSASQLSKRFDVTVRTIQRDMETIELAGIPVQAIQGANGGYRIMDSWKIDRQLLSKDDLFYIITALGGIGSTLEDKALDGTLEKMKTLLPEKQWDFFSEKNERLSIDFSSLGGDPRQQKNFKLIKQAVENQQLIEFEYTSNQLKSSKRTLEPMTISFKWRSWYLFGFCRDREDYRLFRMSRIKKPVLLDSHFRRREKSFEEYSSENSSMYGGKLQEIVLKFSPSMRGLVEEYYNNNDCEESPDGSLIVKAQLPDDGWVYGFILSYGTHVEVLEPSKVRENLAALAKDIAGIYTS